MGEGKFLAIDFGVETGRVMLGTLADGKLTLEEKHRFATPSGRLNGRVQWDLLGLWEHTKFGMRQMKGAELSGIGVSGWALDFGLLGPGDEVLGNPVTYADPRTLGVVAAASEKVPTNDVFAATGVQIMPINTLYQLLAMRRQQPATLALAERLLFVPDLIQFLLCGEPKTDVSLATASQLYDPNAKSWAGGLLERFGISTTLLPDVVPSGTVVGTLLKDVADECGLPPAPLIATAGHDTAAAVAAVPAEGDGWAFVVSGSWSFVGVERDGPLINDAVRDGRFTNEAGVGGRSRLLKHVTGLWLVQECRRQFIRDGYDHSTSELVGMAARAKPFGVIVDPDDPTFAVPGLMPQKIAAFAKLTGQPEPATRGATVRACFDSLALKYRRTLEELERLTGRRIDRLHVVGTGAQNETLNQLTADVCGRPVFAGPVEATTAGNVLTQAIAVGAVADLPAARAVVRNSFAVKRYDPKPTPAVEAAYARFESFQQAN